MRFPLSIVLRRVSVATVTAALLAAVTVSAQVGAFPPALEGELWQVIAKVAPADSMPMGATFTANGDLFVADSANATVIVYDRDLNVRPLPDADWSAGQVDDPASPVYLWSPNQMTTATVQVDGGPNQTAILVSDAAANRVRAFTTTGQHLFTMQMDSLQISEDVKAFNGMAMGPAARFQVTTDSRVVLVGSFAAAWSEGYGVVGAVLVYRNQEFLYDGAQFAATTPPQVLTNEESLDPLAFAKEAFGVTFDPFGNLYITDAVTERLSVYQPDAQCDCLEYLFSFGTPVSDGTTAEFFQSYGLAFWPDAVGSGGRLFIADAVNNRVVVYRPDLPAMTLRRVFEMDGLGQLNGFPYAIALDPSRQRIAVTDDFNPGAWILQTPDLAAFDVRVLDSNNKIVDMVCSGNAALGRPPQQYKIQFSLTVPAGHAQVTGAAPQLTIDGDEWPGAPVPGGTYPNTPFKVGEVRTYTYSLTAPGNGFIGTVTLEAGAEITGSSAIDVLRRTAVVSVSDCRSAAPTIVAAPLNPGVTQLSGWTPIFGDETYTMKLDATDDVAVASIEYQVSGANHSVPLDPVPNPDPSSPTQRVLVDLFLMGDTTITFRAIDNTLLPSAWQTTPVIRLVPVVDLEHSEGETVSQLSIGAPVNRSGIRFSATGLPAGLTIDATTGTISGVVRYDALRVYQVVVTETAVADATRSTSVAFEWRIADVDASLVAKDDSYSTAEDTPLAVSAGAGVLANDTVGSARSLTAILVTGPSHGTLGLNADGSFLYTPAPNFFGNDVFVYKANDGSADSFDAAVTIAVNAVNDAPVAAADVATTREGTALTIAPATLLQNDSDVDGGALAITSVQGAVNGSVALVGGQVIFTPAARYHGAASFTYTVSDGRGGKATATVAVTVTAGPANLPPICKPVVTPARIWPPNNKPVYLSLAGITDPEGGRLVVRFTAILQDEPTNLPGQGNTMQDAAIEQNGTRAWVSAERTGTGDGRVYRVSFTATDPAGASCAGTVNVGVPHDQNRDAVLSPGRWNSLTGQLVTPPPAPTAVDDAVKVAKGSTRVIAVLANDVANGLPLTVSIVSRPSKGSAAVTSNGTITFTAPRSTGTTSFTYKVNNGFGGTDTGIVRITIANQSDDDDDHDCGDRGHDHGRDSDHRDRDHRQGNHSRCRHR